MTQVATIIRDQIGGRALFMLGAKNLMADKDRLTFYIRGSKKGNHLTIALAGDDTYTVTLRKVTVRNVRVVQELEGIYVDSLHRTIESMTDLRTSL